MKNGEFAKWSSRDEDGRFSHRGQIVSVSDAGVQLQTVVGTIFVPAGDGELTKTSRVAGLKAEKPKAAKPKAVAKPKAKVAGSKSKLDLVREIVTELVADFGHEGVRRQDVLKIAEARGIKKTTASTMFAKVQKENQQ